MSVEDLARQLENLAITKTIPNTTSVLELNVPLTVDRAAIMASTLNVTGATVLASTLGVTGPITATGGITNGAVQNALTALAGGAQASATQLNLGLNRITTVATAGDSCALPAATAGSSVTVINDAAANAASIYPLGATDVIFGIAAAAPMLLQAGAGVEFRCAVAGTWDMLYLPMRNVQWLTNTTTTTFLANQLSGGAITIYMSTATTPGSIATRTATQMFNDCPGAKPLYNYLLLVGNLSGSANTMTITAGSGVTITGTATVAQNICRVYRVTFDSATALTLQELFAFTIAA